MKILRIADSSGEVVIVKVDVEATCRCGSVLTLAHKAGEPVGSYAMHQPPVCKAYEEMDLPSYLEWRRMGDA